MMIPFANNGHLTQQQLNFNRTLSQSRVRVENAFGRAKGKWRRIKYMYVRNHEVAIDHITAAFVLHNFIILEGEQLMDVRIFFSTYYDVIYLAYYSKFWHLQENELMRPINNNEVLGDEEFQDENEDIGADIDPALIPLFEEAEGRGQEKRMHIMANLGNFLLE